MTRLSMFCTVEILSDSTFELIDSPDSPELIFTIIREQQINRNNNITPKYIFLIYFILIYYNNKYLLDRIQNILYIQV